MAHIPCFLCRDDLEIRKDKNGKRYFICDGCGVQAFVRRKQGISKLAKLVRQLKKRSPEIKSPHAQFEFSAALNEIDQLQKQINRLKSKTGFFSADADKKKLLKVLQTRVSALFSVLEKHATNVRPSAK